MGEKLQTTSPLKVHNKFIPKRLMLLGRVCTKSKFGLLTIFFSFSLAWDRMGKKNFKRHFV